MCWFSLSIYLEISDSSLLNRKGRSIHGHTYDSPENRLPVWHIVEISVVFREWIEFMKEIIDSYNLHNYLFNDLLTTYYQQYQFVLQIYGNISYIYDIDVHPFINEAISVSIKDHRRIRPILERIYWRNYWLNPCPSTCYQKWLRRWSWRYERIWNWSYNEISVGFPINSKRWNHKTFASYFSRNSLLVL